MCKSSRLALGDVLMLGSLELYLSRLEHSTEPKFQIRVYNKVFELNRSLIFITVDIVKVSEFKRITSEFVRPFQVLMHICCKMIEFAIFIAILHHFDGEKMLCT